MLDLSLVSIRIRPLLRAEDGSEKLGGKLANDGRYGKPSTTMVAYDRTWQVDQPSQVSMLPSVSISEVCNPAGQRCVGSDNRASSTQLLSKHTVPISQSGEGITAAK
jgi:hypothetical protein